MITLANIRRSVYNLFKRVEGIEEFLFQFITDWTDFKEEGIVANQAFPETWHRTGVLNNLIQDINADDAATTGKVYTATVSFNDLPSNMLQAELKVEIKEDSGKVILFTLISNDTSPYYWLGISSYSGEVVWKSFLTEHQDISGKANTEDLATVATTGDYNDLINKPSALGGGKSAYDLAVDNGFEGTEQEWLASLKGPQGIQGIQGIQGPAGQNGSDGADGQDGAPGLDGHSPVVTASKSGSTTTIYVDGTSIATIEDGLDGQDGSNGTNGTNGLNGVTPHIDSTSKHWMIGSTDTGIVAEGQNGSNGANGTNGVTPHIDSTTGNWFIGTTDTGVHAQGPAGQDGSNGANGIDGQDGHTPVITASKSNGVTTVSVDGTTIATINDGQDGSNGTNGTNGTDGTDGITPTVNVTAISNGHKVAFDYGTGDSRNIDFNVMDGNVANQLQADWNLIDNTLTDYIKNKPTIPTKASDLKNDCNFLKVANYNIDQNLYVDMGLPSGTLWAKKSIDVTQADGFAASEYQYEASFFSWGNTDGHNPTSNSSFSPYDFGSGNLTEPYVSSEGAKISYPGSAGLSHDAARIVLGGLWRTPAVEDFVELFDSNYTKFIDASGNDIASDVTDKLVTVNSTVGIRLKSKVNGNTIFFPCSGYGAAQSWYYRDSRGYFWSTSLSSNSVGYYLNFSSNGVNPQYGLVRSYGFAIRPIISTKFTTSDAAITGDYNDLINKPTIPTKTSDLTNDSGFLTSHLDISGKANTADLATVATSGSYTDLSNKPTILSLSPADSNNHTYVDLSLPSGTLWATTNIGALSLIDIGNYYAYGKGNSQHNGSDSVYSGVESPLSLSVDTARQVWSGDWHMPTKEQYEELIAYTTYTYEYNFDSSGVNGAKFTASNGNYIFLPASGYLDDNEYLHDSTCVNYLTSSSYSSNKSYCLLATASGASVVGNVERKDGRAVRGVLNTISKVSTTGSYNDLLDTPTIPTVPSNRSAVNGGTTLSVVTTGEKYTWNNKANIWRGTQTQYDAITTPDNNTIYIITSAS